jgi:hypothetical protein
MDLHGLKEMSCNPTDKMRCRERRGREREGGGVFGLCEMQMEREPTEREMSASNPNFT